VLDFLCELYYDARIQEYQVYYFFHMITPFVPTQMNPMGC